jgi:hypothetical protein
MIEEVMICANSKHIDIMLVIIVTSIFSPFFLKMIENGELSVGSDDDD